MQISCYDMRGVNAKIQNSMLDMFLFIKLFHKNSRLDNEKILFSEKIVIRKKFDVRNLFRGND